MRRPQLSDVVHPDIVFLDSLRFRSSSTSQSEGPPAPVPVVPSSPLSPPDFQTFPGSDERNRRSRPHCHNRPRPSPSQPRARRHPRQPSRLDPPPSSRSAMDSAQYTNPKHFNAYTGAGTPPREKGHKAAHKAPADVAADTSGDARLLQLTAKLSQYTRGADRRQVLRSLMDPALLPRMHPLKSVWVEDIAAAEREAAGERAALNGVKFLQVKHGGGAAGGEPLNAQTPVDSYFLQTLREICGHMCDMDGVDADPMALYGGLLLRLSRAVSERDALEVVTQWACGKGELVVLPLKRRHHRRPGAPHDLAAAALRPAAPLDVELYVEAGSVHAKVTMSHLLGIYRRTDLESHGLTRELSPWTALVLANGKERLRSPGTGQKLSRIQYEALDAAQFPANLRPWIFVDGDVVERINFGTGSSVRMLHVSLPKDKNSGYVKKW